MTDRTEAEKYFSKWTPADSLFARQLGWDLIDYDHSGLLQLQRLDGDGRFCTDREARCYVQGMATAGDPTAMRALLLDVWFSPLIASWDVNAEAMEPVHAPRP